MTADIHTGAMDGVSRSVYVAVSSVYILNQLAKPRDKKAIGFAKLALSTVCAKTGNDRPCAAAEVSRRSRSWLRIWMARLCLGDHRLIGLTPSDRSTLHDAKWSARGFSFAQATDVMSTLPKVVHTKVGSSHPSLKKYLARSSDLPALLTTVSSHTTLRNTLTPTENRPASAPPMPRPHTILHSCQQCRLLKFPSSSSGCGRISSAFYDKA